MPENSPAPTEDAILEWTRERVAFYLECPGSDIEVDRPLTAYGFDSVFALAICGDIEDEYDLQINPTLAWDYPTVAAIMGHLVQILRDSSSTPSRPTSLIET